MMFTMILICLLVQRWFYVKFEKPYFNWFEKYRLLIEQRYGKSVWWDGLGGLVAVILPLFLVYAVLIALISTVLGGLIYYLLGLLVLWYYMDAAMLEHKRNVTGYPGQVLAECYQHIFARIFWMVLAGPFGVILYAEISHWASLLSRDSQGEGDKPQGLHLMVIKLEGLLDWIPVRLLGLSYALVGHFSPIFQEWRQKFSTGIEPGFNQAATYGLIALDLQHDEQQPITAEQRTAIDHLISRTLLVWLLVLALFTIARWWS